MKKSPYKTVALVKNSVQFGTVQKCIAYLFFIGSIA